MLALIEETNESTIHPSRASVPIPPSILDLLSDPATPVTLREMRFALYLARHTWGQGCLSIELRAAQISQITGYSAKNTYVAIRGLERLGILVVDRRPGRASRYSLRPPPTEIAGGTRSNQGGSPPMQGGGSNPEVNSRLFPQAPDPKDVFPTYLKPISATPPSKTGGAPPQKRGGYPPKSGGGQPRKKAQISAEKPHDSAGLDELSTGNSRHPPYDLLVDHRSISSSSSSIDLDLDLQQTTDRCLRVELDAIAARHPAIRGLIQQAPELARKWGAPDGRPIRNLVGLLRVAAPACVAYWVTCQRKERAGVSRIQRHAAAEQQDADTACEEYRIAEAALAKLPPAEQGTLLRRHAGVFDPDTRAGRIGAVLAWWRATNHWSEAAAMAT